MIRVLPPFPPFLDQVRFICDDSGVPWLIWTYLGDRPRKVMTLMLTSSSEETT